MIRRRSVWLTAMLISAALIAGCGSSSSNSTTSATTTTTSTPSTTSTSTSSTTTPSTSSTPALTGAAKEQAVAACKASIESAKTLPSGAKTKLEGVCEKAAEGNQDAVKKAAQEVCEEVVKNAGVPSGSAEEQALGACKAK